MIRSALIRMLGGTPPPAAALREAAGGTVDRDEDQWRPLTGDGRRDLSPLTQSRMRKLATHLWETNLLARQLVELPVAFLLADGVRVRVPDPDAQKWLDAWWRDPVTDMPLRLPELMRDLALAGETAWPVFADPASGHVRMAWLDPDAVETVVMDPDNASRPIGIVTVKDRRGEARRYRTAVGGPETVLAPAARAIRETMTSGDILYFRANARPGASRGRSDLLAAIDWLDGYERHLFGEIDRAHFLRAFVWDVTMTGASQEEVEKRAARATAPTPGTVRVHNESETWQPLAPDLGGRDLDATSRLFRNHLLGGSGLPEHWFGGGGDVNRATAAEMGDPAFKTLKMRQRLWTEILRRAADYAIARRLDPSGASWPDPADPALAVSVEWPEMVVADASRHAAALAQTAGAAALAIERGLLSDATALRVIAAVAGRLGVEIDADAELEAAREDAAGRAEEDAFREPPQDEDADDGEA